MDMTPRPTRSVARRSTGRGPSDEFVPRVLTAAQIEQGRMRPTGSAAERAARVRDLLGTSTFTVAPRPRRRTYGRSVS